MTRAYETARSLAPEDVSVGGYIAVLHDVNEYHYPTCDSGVATARKLSVPTYTDFPVKVASVCLPFVYVETAKGETDILDVRAVRLAAVPARFAAAIHDRERRAAKRKS